MRIEGNPGPTSMGPRRAACRPVGADGDAHASEERFRVFRWSRRKERKDPEGAGRRRVVWRETLRPQPGTGPPLRALHLRPRSERPCSGLQCEERVLQVAA